MRLIPLRPALFCLFCVSVAQAQWRQDFDPRYPQTAPLEPYAAPAAPPIADVPPPSTEPSDDDDTRGSAFLDLASLRVGTYRIRGSDADTNTTGFLFAIDPDLIATEDYVTGRFQFYGALGGGTDGFEGELEWGTSGGVRGYLGEDHGPFARVGFALGVLGNNKIYRSSVELPVLQLGYQIASEDLLVELAGTGSVVLGGRYYTGDRAERRIDTEPAFGGFLTVHADGFRLHGAATRILASQTGPGTPIDRFDSQACLNPVSFLFLCAHAAFHRGDVELPGGTFRESTALYLGGTVGVGLIETFPTD